jgi:hypothetical protein
MTGTCEMCKTEGEIREIEQVKVCERCVSPQTWQRRNTNYPLVDRVERRKEGD